MLHRATLEDELWLRSLPPEDKEKLAKLLRVFFRGKLSEYDITEFTK